MSRLASRLTSRPLNDSPYLYGLHDPGGEHIMAEQKVHGWILFTEEIGSNADDHSGRDYSRWAEQGFGIMARLNNAYEPGGTIPFSHRYADFAARCANFVRNSQGCHIWIIGNEMNHPVERPGINLDWGQQPPAILSPGEAILPGLYANCYRQCRAAIKAVKGHGDDQVVVGAVAPWNAQTTYPENPNGDWVKYLTDVLLVLGPSNCDAISIHAYTHGADPALVSSDTYMDSPFQNRQFNFRTYQDFMRGIPASMRTLPVYLTEVDQNEEWLNQNNGWVQRVYGEINWWNKQTGTQKIRAVILYRWPRGLDKWGIEGKAGIIEDFRQALAARYTWVSAEPVKTHAVEYLSHTTPSRMTAGQTVRVTLVLRNGGTASWPAEGPNAVKAGYRWLDKAGRPLQIPPQADLRTALPKTVGAGEQVTVEARLAAPDVSGTYSLQWDLYEEGQGWFSQKGCAPAQAKVSVQTAVPEPIVFEETGRSARGAFASFYYQHGLEITGYPISEEYVHPQSGLKTQEWQRVIMEECPPGKIRLRLAGQEVLDLRRQVEELRHELEALKGKAQETAPMGPQRPEGGWPPLFRHGAGGRGTARGVSRPEMVDLVDSLPRHASRTYRTRSLDGITHIAIHQSGAGEEITAEHIAAYQVGKGWPGIGYHFLVGADGTIFQTNRLETLSHHVAGANRYAVGVCLAGAFDEAAPAAAQIDQTARLLAWLACELGISLERIWGHCEFPRASVSCPGRQFLKGERYKEALLAGTRAIMAQEPGVSTAPPAGEPEPEPSHAE